MALIDRAPDRKAYVLMRVSVEERDALRDHCEAQGITMQAYLEYLVYGRVPKPRKHGRKPATEKDIELPMTG